ncbi:MAG: helix-turn-helix transcriptional regulator [Flavobacteriales bacterium]|nr:helix-turn-helix transcriptional regulator [Flavobacteriales bacterium]
MPRASSSPAKLTTPVSGSECPAEQALRSITGKWKPRIMRSAAEGPIRFNALLRDLPGSTRQSLANALRELEEGGVLARRVVRLKPLHVEYSLTDLGLQIVPLLFALEPAPTR